MSKKQDKTDHCGKNNSNFGNLYGVREDIHCLQCGKVVTFLKSQRRKFCSLSCSTIFSNVHRATPATMVQCMFCGANSTRTHIQYLDHYRKKMKNWFCSKQCCGKFYRNKKRENTSVSTIKAYLSGRKIVSTRVGGGIRKDLGKYFRSGWEANFARTMNFLGKRWQYEPQVFPLVLGGKTITYRPDFYLPEEDRWVEIKGYWKDEQDKAKYESFKMGHNIELISLEEYRKLYWSFGSKIDWEGKTP